MKKAEIKYLMDAGFSVEEIQAMENGQNAQTAPEPQQPAPAQPDPQPDPQPAAPATAPAQPDPQPDPQPAAPATAPAASLSDNNPEITALLNKILGAIQAQNRSAAAVTTPQTLSPEEIAGKLL